MQQGIVYFFVILLLNLFNVLGIVGQVPSAGWKAILAGILEYVPAYALTPRFIISIREMYARDVQGRRGSGIDSGFGLSAISGRGSVAGGPIVFAKGVQSDIGENVGPEDGQNEGIENVEVDAGHEERGSIEEIPREAALA